MKPTKEQIEALARLAMSTRPTELSCEEMLHLIGRFAELVSAGALVPPELQPVAEHLLLCSECAEELESLRRTLGEG
jgi:hypothetical protein